MLAKARLYWHTARYLKPVQITERLRRRFARPRPNLAPAPSLRAPSGPWAAPTAPAPSLSEGPVFDYLGQKGALAEIGWDGGERTKLWRYNQHYFADLVAEGAAQRAGLHRSLILDWCAANPPGQGTGWEPYPCSVRIVNWIKWALAGNALPDAARHSLAVQIRWLTQNLERHLLGNHLFANAKALVFAGFWFDGEEAASWRALGFQILAAEVPEQILDDGSQFELSPMYHALAVEDVADLVNITTAFQGDLEPDEQAQAEDWAKRLPMMLAWLAAMSHPDGEIAFFNDAAQGIAPHPYALWAYCTRLNVPTPAPPQPLTWLQDSGYARLSAGQAVLIADVAAIGPDYIPGHAHADTLSFELSLGTQRVFVNSGTSEYGAGPERQRQRGTAAHNTVILAGQDSSEVWGGFRVARRARTRNVSITNDGDTLALTATHDGYRRLPGAPMHTRHINLNATELQVVDQVTPATVGIARYHLHPDVQIRQTAPKNGTLTLPDGCTLHWQAQGGTVQLEAASWHPRFGASLPTSCLTIALTDGAAGLSLSFEPEDPV